MFITQIQFPSFQLKLSVISFNKLLYRAMTLNLGGSSVYDLKKTEQPNSQSNINNLLMRHLLLFVITISELNKEVGWSST